MLPLGATGSASPSTCRLIAAALAAARSTAGEACLSRMPNETRATPAKYFAVTTAYAAGLSIHAARQSKGMLRAGRGLAQPTVQMHAAALHHMQFGGGAARTRLWTAQLGQRASQRRLERRQQPPWSQSLMKERGGSSGACRPDYAGAACQLTAGPATSAQHCSVKGLHGARSIRWLQCDQVRWNPPARPTSGLI